MTATAIARATPQGAPTPAPTRAPTPTPETSSLGDLNLGATEGKINTRKEIAREAVKSDLIRTSRVEGADGFFAAFLKTVGGREGVNPGQVVKGPQLGREVNLTKPAFKDKPEVKPGGAGEGASLQCTAEFLEKIGSRARVHLVVPTPDGFKQIESAVGPKDGSFSFSKDAASYPPGTRILIEPCGTKAAWAKDRVGQNPNMHMPLVSPN